MIDDKALRFAAVYGSFVVALVMEKYRLTSEWADDEQMSAIVEEAQTVAEMAEDAWIALNNE